MLLPPPDSMPPSSAASVHPVELELDGNEMGKVCLEGRELSQVLMSWSLALSGHGSTYVCAG